MAEKLDLDLDGLEQSLKAIGNVCLPVHATKLLAMVNRIRELERASQPGSGDHELRDAVRDYETMRDTVGGCTDGGCLVKKPIGMHTNGGCKCHKDPLKAARMMWAGSKLFDAARASLDGRREG